MDTGIVFELDKLVNSIQEDVKIQISSWLNKGLAVHLTKFLMCHTRKYDMVIATQKQCRENPSERKLQNQCSYGVN